MTEPEYLRLINEEIDGELSTADAERLAEILKHDEAAREVHAELKALSAMIDGVPDPAPPTGLRESLLETLESQAAKREAARASASYSWWKPATAMAASVVCAVGLIVVFDGEQIDDRAVTGTMVTPGAASIQRKNVELPALAAEVAYGWDQQTLSFQMRLDSSQSLTARLSYPASLKVASSDGRDEGADGISWSVAGEGRDASVTFLLREGARLEEAELSLIFQDAGTPIHTERLKIDRPEKK